MCNSPNCSHDSNPFADLDDNLDDIFGGPISAADLEAGKRLADSQVARFTEPCKKCRGRGRFISYAGRDCGPCFTCKGSGKQTFKTDAATRAKGREAAARAADRKADAIREQAQAWREANRDDWNWMSDRAESFEFAGSMVQALAQYGHLTEKQHATVTRLRIADAERQAARNAERAEREANAPAVDVALIERAFATAQANGIKRPRMVLDGIKFSLAPAHGRNAGALYVVRRSDDQYLGKIMGGRFSRVRECSVEQEAEIVRIASNPHGEAVAYGQRTGVCCICGRELTNHASIDAGIGPICAEKYGW